MTVAVLIPFRPGCPYRERAWSWVEQRYTAQGFDVVTGTTDVEGFSRTQAILDARRKAYADVFVIADADVFTDSLDDGIREALIRGWSVPNGLLHRLSEAATHRVLLGDDWRGQPLSQDNPQDSQPYRVHEAGTLLVVTAEAFDLAPPDPRFIGWGQEDDAWATALRALVGPPWRGNADLVHLYHPAEPRQSRVVGNEANRRLLRRYRSAARSRTVMVDLIEEGRQWASTSAPTASA